MARVPDRQGDRLPQREEPVRWPLRQALDHDQSHAHAGLIHEGNSAVALWRTRLAPCGGERETMGSVRRSPLTLTHSPQGCPPRGECLVPLKPSGLSPSSVTSFEMGVPHALLRPPNRLLLPYALGRGHVEL